MNKYFLIVILMIFHLMGCTNIDDTPQAPESSVIIDPVATDDILDAQERAQVTQTVSGSASGGYIEDGNAVAIVVNGITYSTILSEGNFSVEVSTRDIIKDKDGRIVVLVTSTNAQTGGEVVKGVSKLITFDGEIELKEFAHPGLLVNQAAFDRIKTKVNAGAEPWLSGWNKLITNSYASLNYTPTPVVKLIRGGGSREEPEPDNYGAAFRDAAAAFQTAIRWKVTGDAAYAEKSIQILNAWANTCTSISGDSNKALGAGIYGNQFANAAEIMRDYEGWSVEDFTVFKKWIVDVFYTVSKDFIDTHYNTCISHYWANWDLVNIANILSISVLTENEEMYDFAINYLKTGNGNGNLNKAIYYIHPDGLGQLQESGRDQGHTLLCVGYLGDLARMAYNQGDGLFAYDDNRILKAAEYAAKYNVASLSVPYETYNNCDNVNQTVISNIGRGEERPIWENLYNFYVVKMGYESPYLKLAVDTYGVEGGGGHYGPNSGGFDSLGFGTLLYSEE